MYMLSQSTRVPNVFQTKTSSVAKRHTSSEYVYLGENHAANRSPPSPAEEPTGERRHAASRGPTERRVVRAARIEGRQAWNRRARAAVKGS